MSREWKPSDVQVVLSMHPSRVQELAHWLRSKAKTPGAPVLDYAEQIEEQGHGARLVVIDPEDAEQVERLADMLTHARQGHGYGNAYPGDVDRLQVALREFADPKPPKPEEPTGLGAVVIDAAGRRYVRCDVGHERWHCPDDDQGEYDNYYEDIDVVRVLSEGVTP